MIIKMPYDESWEANDHLNFWTYSIQNPTSSVMNGYTEGLFDKYYMLNQKRRYINPEDTIKSCIEEDNEGKSLREFFE